MNRRSTIDLLEQPNADVTDLGVHGPGIGCPGCGGDPASPTLAGGRRCPACGNGMPARVPPTLRHARQHDPIPPDELDALADGLTVELEHEDVIGDRDPETLTRDDVRDAISIATDHLDEVPDYYDRLRQVEGDPPDLGLRPSRRAAAILRAAEPGEGGDVVPQHRMLDQRRQRALDEVERGYRARGGRHTLTRGPGGLMLAIPGGDPNTVLTVSADPRGTLTVTVQFPEGPGEYSRGSVQTSDPEAAVDHILNAEGSLAHLSVLYAPAANGEPPKPKPSLTLVKGETNPMHTIDDNALLTGHPHQTSRPISREAFAPTDGDGAPRPECQVCGGSGKTRCTGCWGRGCAACDERGYLPCPNCAPGSSSALPRGMNAQGAIHSRASDYQNYYDSMSTGQWASPDVERCPCYGRGYVVSDLDTVHKCPFHYEEGVTMMPEEYDETPDLPIVPLESDWDKEGSVIHRRAYEATPVATPEGLDEFTRSYLQAAAWSTSATLPSDDDVPDENGMHLEDRERAYGPSHGEAEEHRLDDLMNDGVVDWSVEAIEQAKEECGRFQNENWDDIQYDLKRAGYDFWMTRVGHGVGFWDGGWEEDVGRRLTEASKRFGEIDLYVGDDMKLYFTPGRPGVEQAMGPLPVAQASRPALRAARILTGQSGSSPRRLVDIPDGTDVDDLDKSKRPDPETPADAGWKPSAQAGPQTIDEALERFRSMGPPPEFGPEPYELHGVGWNITPPEGPGSQWTLVMDDDDNAEPWEFPSWDDAMRAALEVVFPEDVAPPPDRQAQRRSLQVGDPVRYAASFLQSIGAYTGAMGQAKGTITAIDGAGSSFQIATVDWGPWSDECPARVNVKNLHRAGDPDYSGM